MKFEEGEENWTDVEFDPTAFGIAPSEEVKDTSACLYKIMDMSEVEERINSQTEIIKEMLCVSEDSALILLTYYRWNIEKLQLEYLENPQGVLQKAGVSTLAQEKIKKKVCTICTNPLKDSGELYCKHAFCGTCWASYLSNAIVNSGKAAVYLKCPEFDCSLVVTKSLFKRFLSSLQYQEYKKFICKTFTDDNKAIRWCPAPGCRFLVRNDLLTTIEIVCKCGYKYCFGCGEQTHSPCSCEMVCKWRLKEHSESESMNWILVHAGQCPNCHKFIEKNQGCNHVTCTQCRYEFCWVCHGDWKLHSYKTGGYYRCNRYDEKIETTKKLKQENRERAKNELARYSFFYERYQNYTKSMKHSEDLKEEIDTTESLDSQYLKN